jgi:hypothetical protein
MQEQIHRIFIDEIACCLYEPYIKKKLFTLLQYKFVSYFSCHVNYYYYFFYKFSF